MRIILIVVIAIITVIAVMYVGIGFRIYSSQKFINEIRRLK